ncbi:YccV-like-domain-containing protein [Mycena alexandri]|uniref:YccV-like-domain-containing protein n=1 Tax=Mycena alexandri TaxID=1745969 RepID=A0AAD6T7S3_9AGAR|nr:YccV-like-domain-containing protein [Mycena alexandri]
MLPLDLYIAILEQVPAHRTESGVLTLVNCLRTSTQLREAALVGSLWESHYKIRYLRGSGESEGRQLHSSESQAQRNWYLLYTARRRKDRLGLELLDQMVAQRQGRYSAAKKLAAMSFDIWDALDIECMRPVPILDGSTVSAAPYALTRRFWADAVLSTISKRFAIMQWGLLGNGEINDGNFPSFVDAFLLLSCFFGRDGKTPQELRTQLSDLGNACRQWLEKQRCNLDPAMPEYDLREICTKICRVHARARFWCSSQFHDIENHFPHLYLTTNKQSIPISLVHIFVSIARHLGVSASPVEFPGRVLAHVPSPPGFDDFLVDVYGADTKPVVSLRDDIPMMLMRLGIPPNNLLQYVSPCGASPMLLRAARNILSSFRMMPQGPIAQSALYAAVCIHLLLTNEIPLVAHMLSHVDLDPLHCSTFLADLQPLLRGGGQQLLETSCRNSLELEEQEASRVHPRTTQIQIAHYVGIVFKHRSHNYVGCIVGWDSKCRASEQWQLQMNVQRLARGANQPFYHVLSLDGGERYVAEDNVAPTELTGELAQQFLQAVPILPRYFSDVFTHPESCRGRWRLSPESKFAYPDDEHFAQLYDEYGVV